MHFRIKVLLFRHWV